MSITEINTSNRSTTVNTPDSSSVVTTASRSTSVTPNRQTAINALAVVGFIALIGAAMWLAVYSTRYVPGVVNRIGSAAVYLGSVFNSGKPSLSVVSTPPTSTTIPFSGASSTVSTNEDSTTVKTPTVTKPVSPPTAGGEITATYPIGGTSAAVAPYGLPDLAVSIDAVGYLTTASTDSFVANSTIPSGSRPAVKFSIKNVGTNWTGTWRFTATIPTRGTYVYQSESQQSLAPGDSIDYILGFDRASTGTGQQLTITANSDHTVTDSNTANDTGTAYINVI